MCVCAHSHVFLLGSIQPTMLHTICSDCQQQAGLAAWVPFQDSASAVTQLYKGMRYSWLAACIFVFVPALILELCCVYILCEWCLLPLLCKVLWMCVASVWSVGLNMGSARERATLSPGSRRREKSFGGKSFWPSYWTSRTLQIPSFIMAVNNQRA